MNRAEDLVKKLIESNKTVTTAESCTGGMVSSLIVDVAGASEVLNEAHVTYSNESKQVYLDVDKEVLDTLGAVSEETAIQMAIGAANRANANLAIVTTGIAGPGGGTDTKPVGLVYIGCYLDGKIVIEKHIFDGDRQSVREQAANTAIDLAYQLISEI